MHAYHVMVDSMIVIVDSTKDALHNFCAIVVVRFSLSFLCGRLASVGLAQVHPNEQSGHLKNFLVYKAMASFFHPESMTDLQ